MTSPHKLRGTFLALAIGGAMAAGPALARPVVIELFTSQACSSCPPADALLAVIAARAGIIALSLPIDYWDYRGWTDTLAKHAHTERQRGYSMARGDGEVYTPQAVVNGLRHVIGSDRQSVEAALAAAAMEPGVEVATTRAGSTVRIDIAAAAGNGPSWGTVWILLYDATETVAIGRGDNAGRMVTYTNVVIEMHRLAMWRGDAMSFELPMMELMEAKADGCVILVQEERDGLPGAIVGAASYAIAAW